VPGLSETVELDHQIQRPERVGTGRERSRSKPIEHQSRGDRLIASFWRKKVLGKGKGEGVRLPMGKGRRITSRSAGGPTCY
jgi:hypothetical protein